MADVRVLVKGEKLPLPVSRAGGKGSGWVTADPKVDGLLVVPPVDCEAVILSEADLADFGYVRKSSSRDSQKRSATPRPKK